MDKMKYSDWFRSVVAANTNELRDRIEGSGKTKAQKALISYFSKGELKRSGVRLDALKELFKDLGHEDDIKDITLEQLDTNITPIRLSFMRCMNSQNGHNYGNQYFLVASGSAGFRQDGDAGNSFPAASNGRWECPSEDKARELAEKYLELSLKEGTELRDFIRSMKPFTTAFVNFDEFDRK